MSCDRHRPALLDVALGRPAGSGVQAHLDTCRTCQAIVEDERRRLAAIDGALQASLGVSPSPAFLAGARRRSAEMPPGLAWRAPTLVPVAVAIVGLALAVVLARRGSEPSPVGTAAVRREAPGRVASPPVEAVVTGSTVRVPATAAASRASTRPPRVRARSEQRVSVLVDPNETRAFALLIERLQAAPDDALAAGLRVSDAADAPLDRIGELPPVVIAPLEGSDS